MIEWLKGSQTIGRAVCKSGIKTAGKKAIRMVVKTPSIPIAVGVDILEATVMRSTGSEKLARRAALIGQVVACAPLGPLAVVGGVARWKLDKVVDRL